MDWFTKETIFFALGTCFTWCVLYFLSTRFGLVYNKIHAKCFKTIWTLSCFFFLHRNHHYQHDVGREK